MMFSSFVRLMLAACRWRRAPRPPSRRQGQACVDDARFNLVARHSDLVQHVAALDAANHIAGLTPRQRQVMELVLAGQPSKIIAADLILANAPLRTIALRL